MGDTKNIKIIIAGTHGEYLEYLKESNETPKTAIYLSIMDKIRGYKDYEIVYYGTGFYRNDLNKRELEHYEAISSLKD